MANIKISDATANPSAAGTDMLATARSGSALPFKTTLAQVAAFVAASLPSSSAAIGRVPTINDLTGLPIATYVANAVIEVIGAKAIGDGGGGQFYYSSSSTATVDGALVQSTSSGSGRWLRIMEGKTMNVLWFGADKSGSTFSTSAIQAAIDSCPSGGVVFFPPGNYKSGALTIGATNISLKGAGVASSQILFNSNSLNCIAKVGTSGAFEISDLRLFAESNVTASWLIYIAGVSDYPRTIRIHDIEWYIAGVTGGISCDVPTDGHIFNVRGQNAGGGTGLRLHGGIDVNDSYIYLGGSVTNPCVWLTAAPLTSSSYSNCGFGGGGPAKRFAISTIASNSSTFTVNTSATHSFIAGDVLVIRGASVASYNSMWEILSVTTNSITVSSTGNFGAATGGNAESVSGCFIVDNTSGALNESRISNCLFENAGGGNRVYGTAGLIFNGRGSTSQIFGWTVSNCYYDYGSIGFMVDGRNDNVLAMNFIGGHLQCDSYGALIRNANDILVSGMHLGKAPNSGTTNLTPNSCGIAVIGKSALGGSSGVMVRDCNLVTLNEGDAGASLHAYGVYILGDDVNELSISGCKIFGTTAAIGDASTNALDRRWNIKGNLCASGAWPIASLTRYRPIIPSGSSTFALPLGCDNFKAISCDITTLTGGFPGREVRVSVNADSYLRSGGNIAMLSGYKQLRAGSIVDMYFDNDGRWYVNGGIDSNLGSY